MRAVRAPGYNILVKLKKIKTNSGIILQERTQKAVEEAYIVDVGPDAFKFKDIECSGPWCKRGDCVAFIRYAGKEITDVEKDETYRIIRDTDIVAVFPEESIS
jgi:co-chaperonin GroES (HSP10)